jgi:flagellin-like protein
MRVYLHNQKRKAISPVLATVILIAITLIAAIAVAGFVFGLFGSFTSSARVQVSTPSLSHTIAGTLLVLNTGTSNTNVNSMSLTYGGQTCAPAITAPVPATITAGVAPGITLTVAAGACAAAAVAGEAYSGILYLSNGAQVPFTGQFS